MNRIKMKFAEAPAPDMIILLTAISSERGVLAMKPRMASLYTITPITAAITSEI